MTDAAGTIAVDFNDTNNYTCILDVASTLANPTNQTAGQSGIFEFKQDATGGRTLAFGTDYEGLDGALPSIATGGGEVTMLSYYVRASTSVVLSMVENVS